jgi:hypothetical protein
LRVVNFAKHQNPHRKETASRLPPSPTETHEEQTQGAPRTDPGPPQGAPRADDGAEKEQTRPAGFLDSRIPGFLDSIRAGAGRSRGSHASKGKKKAAKGSVFSSVDVETLRDDRKLSAWYEHATAQRKPVVAASGQNLRRVFEAAEHALAVGDNPPALFAHTVSRADWQVITQADEDRARERLRGYGRNGTGRSGTSNGVRHIGDVLCELAEQPKDSNR